MEVSQTSQFAAFLGSLLVGALLGTVWDAIRLSRLAVGVLRGGADLRFAGVVLPVIGKPLRQRERKRAFLHVFLFFGDVFFFVIAAVVFRLFLFAVQDGVFRFYLLFGAAAGFFAYENSVGRLVYSVSDYLLFGIRVALAYLFFFLLFPFRAAAKGMRCVFSALVAAARQKRRNRRTRRVTRGYFARMKKEAQNGFLQGDLLLP